MSEKPFNPIDKDKITETPHLLPYAHTVGGAIIKPIDKGRVKGNAMVAMYEQTNIQMDQIREQIELLAQQAREIQNRVELSERIYLAEINFKPVINHVYNLYEKKNGNWVLSMVAPQEWGRRIPFERYIAKVRLMADHTWDVLESPGL